MTGERGVRLRGTATVAVTAAAIGAAALLVCTLLPLGARAAVLRTQVIAQPPVVLLGEPVTVQVSVESSGFLPVASFEVRPVAGVRIEQAGTSQNVVMGAGNVVRTDVAIYRVTAATLGKQRVPAFIAVYGGRPIELPPALFETVSSLPNAGGAPSQRTDDGNQASANLFGRLVVDRRRAWWNEQIIGRIQIFSRSPLEDMPTWEPPEAAGFWSEPLGDPRHGRVAIDGRPYELYERVIAFFPTRPGRLTLGPARARVRVLQRIAPAFDPMGGFFPVAPAEVVELPVEAAPVVITVDALPSGAPSGFRGAVGRLQLGVRVDRRRVRAGEPVTVSTAIRGEGNLASAADPPIVARPAVATYPAGAHTDIDRAGDRIRGVRRRDVAFVPDQAGSLLVLPIEFVWFDPEAGAYRLQRSDTIGVRIEPGQAGSGATATTATALGTPAAPRPPGAPGVGGNLDGWPTGLPLAAGLVSLAGYAGMAIATASRRRSARDPRWRRARLAEAAAQRLAAAARGSDVARAAERVEPLLRDAAGIHFGIDPEGRSRRDLVTHLRVASAPESEIEEVAELLRRLEAGAFAPGGRDEVAAALARAVALAGKWRDACRV